MVKSLNRKLWRDMLTAKGQFLAIIVVVFMGIAGFTSTYMAYQNLKGSVEAYYRSYRLADLSARVTRIPRGQVSQLKAIPGVKEVQGRIVADALLDIEGTSRQVYARIVSLPPKDPINNVFLLSGKHLSVAQPNGVLVEKLFFEARKLKMGDPLHLIVNGKRITLTIRGKAGSPEFIYPMRTAQDLVPSPEKFAVLFAREEMAAALFGMTNTYNDLVFLVEGDQEAVKKDLETALKPYGLQEITKQDEGLSYNIIDSEIGQLKQLASMFPALFLLVAAIIIYLLMIRLVKNQRRQIGVLLALGYSKGQILTHYLLFAVIVAVIGSLAGGLAGSLLGKEWTKLYASYFNIPVLTFRFSFQALYLGLLVSLLFCGLAGWQAARLSLRLSPSEALRPEPPVASKQNTVTSLIFRATIRAALPWRMAVKSLVRSGQRSFFTVLGIALAAALMVVSTFFLDIFQYLISAQYGGILRYDLKVVFNNFAPESSLLEIRRIPGVLQIEPLIEVPIQLTSGWKKEIVPLLGISPDSGMYHFTGGEGRPVKVKGTGLYLPEALAQKLGVAADTMINVNTLLPGGEKKTLPYRGNVIQYLGYAAVADISEARRLLNGRDVVNGALVKVRFGALSTVQERLLDIPGVATAESPQENRDKFLTYMDLTYAFVGVMIVVASIMGLAIVYNTTTMNLLERQRELATLRVLGYTPQEVETIVFLENFLLGLAGSVLGLPLGTAMARGFTMAFGTELMTLPFVIFPRTYIIAALGVVFFLSLTRLPGGRAIRTLDLLETLKSREG